MKYVGLHRNAKNLLYIHHCWVIVECIGYLTKYVIEIIMNIVVPNCEYLLPISIAFPLRYIIVIGSAGIVTGVFSLAIERLIASIQFRIYQQNETTTISTLLVLFQVTKIVDYCR